jgi:two-component system chemotaxis sensor kinase CheA
MAGAETELDRSILEAIRDPMVHLVRNAVDHGIEPPQAREAAGKPPTGTISVRAFHEGGQVHIAIEDDGAGIDPDLIRQEAARRGIASRDQVAAMSDHEALNLIFLPGFSTARSVTNVSGRGVGMDVVRTNVEKLGGSVEIGSQKSEGSRVSITLPLTLAIIPALIVTNGGQRYALPQTSLLELVRLEGAIESLSGAPVYRLRGSLLPLVFLGREFGAAPRSSRSARAREEVNIVVLRAGGFSFGLVVDGIEDTKEIVVKPLGRHLGKHPIFAGATILGDGRVALILDVAGLALHSRVAGEEKARETRVAAPAPADGEAQTLLLLDSHEGGRVAVPLSSVARLEEFPRAAIERIGAREVVQYRSEILPLLRIRHLSRALSGDMSTGRLQVVVYSDRGRSAGIVVDRIHDIVEERVSLRRSEEKGVLGTAIIQKRITEVLDIPSLLRHEAPEIFGSPARVEAAV